MEGLINKADSILEVSYRALATGECSDIIGHPLLRKLAILYAEEASKGPKLKYFHLTHRLLDKLVRNEGLNCLIINLYNGNDGYSLAVKLSSGIETETVHLSYEDSEFLSYIDREELPPMILDLLDESNLDIYHSGCVIAEVRDHQRTLDGAWESHYVLLRATNQSLAADVASLTREKDWTSEEKLYLEAELVKRTALPLILTPSPVVTIVSNKIHRQKYKFSSRLLRRAAKRHSQVFLSRQEKFEKSSPPKSLKLHNFLLEKNELHKTLVKPKAPILFEPKIQMSNPGLDSQQELRKLTGLFSDVAQKIIKPVDRIAEGSEGLDGSQVVVRELFLESELSHGKFEYRKLKIFKRKLDDVHFGELYVDKDYHEGIQGGSECIFQLGNIHEVDMYVKQFRDMISNEGWKTVKITDSVPGQPPQVTTTGLREKREVPVPVPVPEQVKQIQTPSLSQSDLQQPIFASIAGVQQNMSSVSLGGSPQQNIIIVSNSEALKKSIMVSKPLAVSLNQLTTLSSQGQATGQQLVIDRSGTRASILNPRSNITRTVSAAPNIAVAAQINRTVPSYSQAISPQKTQVSFNAGAVGSSKSSFDSSVPTLQALLEGTPSADTMVPLSNDRIAPQPGNVPSSAIVKEATQAKIISVSSNQPTGIVTSTTTLRADSGPPPNVNIANITNFPGLNVGLQSLTGNISALPNVPIAGLVPISLNIQAAGTPTATIASSKLNTSIAASSGSSMVVNTSSIPQAQVVQLPISQLASSQLAAQLAKSTATAGSSGIPVLQVQGVTGQVFASVRDTSAGVPSNQSVTRQAVQLTLPTSQNSGLNPSGDVNFGTIVQTSSTGGVSQPSILGLATKQSLQLALQKQGHAGNVSFLLQKQKAVAAKRSQQQQLQQQQQQLQQQQQQQM